jgi:hypothetical protein
VVVVLAVGLAWVWVDLSGKLATLRSQIAKQETEKKRLENVNEQKTGFEQEKGELERKLAIITRLQKERIVPVHLLDESPGLDGDAVWITSYAHTPPASPRRLLAQPRGAAAARRQPREVPCYKDVGCCSPSARLQGREVFRFSIKAGVEQPE